VTVIRDDAGRRSGAAAPGAAGWLSLAAAPTFVAMALLTVISGGADMMCSMADNGSLLSGMAPMYLLMSAFHSVPWLKLLSRQHCQHACDGLQ
jgi:hypothetical protein